MPLELFDVRDCEDFCWRLVDDAGLELSWHEREDLHAWLLAELWRLSLKYDEAKGMRSFGAFAHHALKRRSVADWLRSTRGRTTWRFKDRVYERKLPRLQSLDADPELVELEPALQSNREAGGDPDFGGLFQGGSRSTAFDYELLGLEPPE